MAITNFSIKMSSSSCWVKIDPPICPADTGSHTITCITGQLFQVQGNTEYNKYAEYELLSQMKEEVCDILIEFESDELKINLYLLNACFGYAFFNE